MKSEPVKLKKSERTRQSILAAAKQAFSTHSYDQIGLREIASQAGVTAALVNRYFGSKQELFREVLQDDDDYSELYEGSTAQLGARLARFLVARETRRKNGGVLAVNFDRLILMLLSVGCPEAVPVLREDLAEKITGPLMQALPGERVEEKASLLISNIFGFLIVHSVIGAACAVRADREEMERLLALNLQFIIDC